MGKLYKIKKHQFGLSVGNLSVTGLLLVFAFLMCFVPQRVSAQVCATALRFQNPTLISGTDKQVGAQYRFDDVFFGVDATVTLTALNDASVNTVDDDSPGTGYLRAFQPNVSITDSDGYAEWTVTFKRANTTSDFNFACVTVSGIDIDGPEFHMTRDYTSYQTHTPTDLSVSPNTPTPWAFVENNTGNEYTGINVNSLSGIVQFNFINRTSVVWRTGASNDVNGRQFSIFLIRLCNALILRVRAVSARIKFIADQPTPQY
ncbi:MAG: hypothetical protein HC817_05700 [Saprospiraceae bacterium]|nr:hypothetical protein [Saprospiraceae bacterium]